ncbi:CDP-diacylglycerol--glycerol-3-phosphate 3-phosphatidyltransferase [Pelagibaculum spongiae]|uniref:CDP-diacylglycerol--glycerol-3-phosphate 3-phosphatidyltransferase n=2 Tax=Pelagibaculum spongiae TaxID=2080658 RepID=A0A2V1H085_9GAMM|nr:CDP-diacylglycerol--glycerol-3-phosphate 3-phosphatidyltransferase [Pelagibaculum spongiae]PVZ69021.1 CDP-diacylglycerol--glycerol-3-phosphate 3-phosphatidyltransferase [Pelagibaculum spongiae]
MNIPNILTLTRICLIPVFVVFFYLSDDTGWRYYTTAIFMLAGFTDWLDGFLARRLKQTSPFGAFLDPVADKLMVAVSLVCLVQDQATIWMALPAAVIIGREIVISALRQWMAEIGVQSRVAVSWIGKVKTSFQMGAIASLICFYQPGDTHVANIFFYGGYLALYIAVVLTIWSMVDYLIAAWPSLKPTVK